MADSSTVRARRSRRHGSGDHSMCRPDRCAAAVEEDQVARSVGRVRPMAFGDSGDQLWDAVTASTSLGPLQMPLLVEACRIADRLDALDRQLHGHDWLRFRHDESGAEVTVYVDRVLAEAREQATALKGIVAELTKPGAAAKPQQPTKGGGVLADLAARRAARSALPAS